MATATAQSKYTQANRPMEVITPLGKDVLLLIGFSGHEAISQLFSFQLDMLAENGVRIDFDKLLGEKITVRLDIVGGKRRFFNGICIRASQGMRDQNFTGYRMEIVPQFWTLTRKSDIRTFQHMPVPDILKKLLAGLDVSYEIQGNFHPRDYCVQYRETDFNFASRLMEEEGIFYFFKHSADGHKMVLANNPQSHPDLPEESKIIFEETLGGKRKEDRVFNWEKVQELRSGKYKLWDHCFELPYKHLEAEKNIGDSVAIGQVNHKQKLGANENLEMYDYPGEYAQRFDGVDKGGGERPADIQKIFEDNRRTVGIRMDQEAVQGVVIQGVSTCRQFTSGHKFTMERHFSADGQYVVTSAQHDAKANVDYRSGDLKEYLYQNVFTAIPSALPFRPPRVTPKPFVQGTHTAVVVGPSGEEIFTDKYGRVKVQFHWDRIAQHNPDSSCWVRVTQPWAGKRWGGSFWPRIGQEVIVDFLEGDPDRPIIVGTVYNADQMPPYQGQGPDPKHPHDNKLCGVKSNSTPGGEGYNEWRFDDTKGKEEIFVHAEKDIDIRVKNDRREWIGHDRHLMVKHDKREEVDNQKHIRIHDNHIEHIDGNMELMVGTDQKGGNQDIVIRKHKKELINADHGHHVNGGQWVKIDGAQDLTVDKDKKELIQGTSHLHVAGDQRQKVDGSQSFIVGENQQELVGKKHALAAGEEIHLQSGAKIVLNAGQRLTITGPGGFLDIGPGGVTIQGLIVRINSGGSAGEGSGSQPTKPEDAEPPVDPKRAQPTKPDEADNSVTGKKSAPDSWS